MKYFVILLVSLFLSDNYIAGQNHNYIFLPEEDSLLICNLFSEINEKDFVVSPIVNFFNEKYISEYSQIRKFGFSKQTKKEKNDTLIIRKNDLFCVIDPDSLLKYDNFVTGPDTKEIIVEPLLYYIKKQYNKDHICYFNKPIFSKNKKYALMKYFISCGDLCGFGEVVLMKKINNKWKINKSLVFIAS